MSEKTGIIILAVLAIIALGYLFMTNEMPNTQPHMNHRNNAPMTNHIENFTDVPAPAEQVYVRSEFTDVDGSEATGENEQPQPLQDEENGVQMNQLPSVCFPKDVLDPNDLLPNDSNSLWAQVSPSGQGSLADQNFLTSGFHIGINTVGQSLRNANRQLRSEPSNPQVKVSPWMQTTIDPDINRRPLEINSADQ
jgi:hypothetical protein